VFYGNPNTNIHHVGLYLGNGHMIDAPTFGKPIGIHPIRRGTNDDFAGGGRIK
jgi:cell wall-associated NlpC family hydrolase